ncbi:hypothetical protein KCP73_25185 [Salmonella enterica subsp. enterica]|nr:hypothetical protein KCP73_25185 [Salmonella enterica subsp. enterica]
MLIIKSTCWMMTTSSIKDAVSALMISSRWVWFTSSNYSLILLKPAVSARTFLHHHRSQNRTHCSPGTRLNNSCSLSMVCYRPTKGTC